MARNKNDLTEGSVSRNLVKLTLPMLLGIFSMVAFNLVDTFYVGKLGANELAAISFTFPVISLIFSLVQGIGIGATALISRSIGALKFDKARRETSDSLMLGLILAGTVSFVGFFTIKPVFGMLGAQGHILALVEDYMSIWYFTIVFVVVPFVGNSAIRATGDARTPAIIMLFAVFVNAVLDPILIFGYGPFPEMGLKGAALATAISRGLTLVLSLYILYFREKLITLEIPPFKILKGCWKSILYIGLPSGFSRMLVPLAISIITATIATYGQESVAAFGVATRIEFLAMSVLFALAASYGPFAGQNFGAGRIDRIIDALKKGTAFSVVWSIAMAIILVFAGEQVAAWFSQSEVVIEKTAIYLSIVPFAFGFQGISQMVNTVLNTLNKPLKASILILITMFGILVPLAKMGAHFYGLQGIFFALAITYTFGGIAAYFFGMYWIKQKEKSS